MSLNNFEPESDELVMSDGIFEWEEGIDNENDWMGNKLDVMMKKRVWWGTNPNARVLIDAMRDDVTNTLESN